MLRRNFAFAALVVVLVGTCPAIGRAQPANDDCAGAVTLALGSNLSTTTASTFSGTDDSCLGSAGDPDVFFSFTATCDGTATFQIANISGDNTLAAWADCTLMTELGCNDGGSPLLTQPVVAGDTFIVQVHGWMGTTGDFDLTVDCVSANAPNDDCATASFVADNGALTSANLLSGTASMTVPTCDPGSEPDLWYTTSASADGVLVATAIANGSAANIALFAACGGAEIACDAAGFGGDPATVSTSVVAGVPIWIRVGAAVAGTFDLSVETFPSAVNDDCSTAIAVSDNATPVAADLAGATASMPGPSCFGGSTADVWYFVTASADGQMVVDAAPLTGASLLGLQVLDGCGGMEIACDSSPFTGSNASVTLSVVAGNPYWISVSADGPISATLTVETFAIPTNDDCASALAIMDNGMPNSASTIGATDSGVVPTCGGGGQLDLWFTVTASADGSLALSFDPDGEDSSISIFASCGGVEIACDTATFGEASFLVVSAVAGDQFWIRASTDGSDNGAFTALLSQPTANQDCATAEIAFDGVNNYSSIGATASGTESLCSNGPTEDVWFEYTATCAGAVQFQLNDAAFDSSIGAFTGVCASLAEYTCTDFFGSGELVEMPIQSGDTVYVRIAGADPGEAGFGTLDISCVAQVIRPEDDCTGAIAVAAQGPVPYNMAGALPGPTGAGCGFPGDPDIWYSYTMQSDGGVMVSDVGPFTEFAIWPSCPDGIVQPLACDFESVSAAGLVAGDQIIIEVQSFDTLLNSDFDLVEFMPAPNDECVNAAPIVDGPNMATVLGSTFSGTDSSCGTGGSADTWYSYTATCTGTLIVDTAGSSFDSTVALLDLCGGIELACNDDGLPNALSSVSTAVMAGDTILVRLFGWTQGDGFLNVQCVPPIGNDDCATAELLSTDGTSVSYDLAAATDSGNVAPCAIGGANDAWFEVVAGEDGLLTVELQSFDDGVLVGFSSCGGQEIACEDNGFFGEVESFSIAVLAGDSFVFRATDNGGNAAGTISASILGDVTGKVLVVDGDGPNGLVDSTAALLAALAANGIPAGDVVTVPPASVEAPLVGTPAAAFVMLGTDIFFSSGNTLSMGQGQVLRDLVVSGVPLYIEGADQFSDISPATPLDDVDGVDNVNAGDGDDFHQGMVGSDLFMGLSGLYNQDDPQGPGSNEFTDELLLATTDILGTDVATLWTDDLSGGSAAAFDTAIRYSTMPAVAGDPQPGNVISSSSEFGGWFGGDAAMQASTLAIMLSYFGVAGTGGPEYIRGDIDENGTFTIADAIALLGVLFVATASTPTCLDTADVDASGTLTLADVIRLLSFLFQGGLAPPAPHPTCDTAPSGTPSIECLGSNVNCVP